MSNAIKKFFSGTPIIDLVMRIRGVKTRKNAEYILALITVINVYATAIIIENNFLSKSISSNTYAISSELHDFESQPIHTIDQ